MARTPARRAISMSSAVSPTYTQSCGSRRRRLSASCSGAGCGFFFAASSLQTHAARACEQRRAFQFIGAHPETISFEPFGAREQSGAVNAQPIGRIVLREFALGPVDAQSMKHREIGAEVGFVGIQERAVPVEEDCARGELCDFHGVGIVSDLSDCEK